MAALIVLVPKENTGIPPIYDAALYLHKAKQLKMDRIRVERLDGAMVTEFPVATVEAFFRANDLRPQAGRRMVRGPDWEPHRPIWMSGGVTGESHGSG